MIDRYAELYAAIFRQALIDDIKTINIKIFKYLTEIGYGADDVRKFIDAQKQEIQDEVQKYLVKEADNYPCGHGTAVKTRYKLINYYCKEFEKTNPKSTYKFPIKYI